LGTLVRRYRAEMDRILVHDVAHEAVVVHRRRAVERGAQRVLPREGHQHVGGERRLVVGVPAVSGDHVVADGAPGGLDVFGNVADAELRDDLVDEPRPNESFPVITLYSYTLSSSEIR